MRLQTVELVMKIRHKQNGLALIALVFLLVLAVTTYIIKSLDSTDINNARDKKTAAALAEAKLALLGWAIQQNSSGQLPCPEDTNKIGTIDEGIAQTGCSFPTPVIGRLPWRTLGLGDVRDGNDDRLWYVISSGFRDAPINNSVSVGQLSVNSTPNVVAIIFSAGIPLSGQIRPIPTNLAPPVVSQYLDGTNSNGDNLFLSANTSNTFNDKLVFVTQSELFSLVTKRILNEIKGDTTQGLVKYYSAHANNYPYADVDGDGFADIATSELVGNPSYMAGSDSLDFSKTITDETGTISMKDALLSNGWFPFISYTVTTDLQHVTLTLNGRTVGVP